MKRGATEEDAFWEIALSRENSGYCFGDCSNSSGAEHAADAGQDDDNDTGNSCDEDLDGTVTSSAVTYRLPAIDNLKSVTFRLAGLKSTGSLSSPLGAQAWYGSALLAALLLEPPPSIAEVLRRTRTALELGSGAVGLSACTLAWVLAHYRNSSTESRTSNSDYSHKVIATDNDPTVLEQLHVNVQSTQKQLSRDFPEYSFPLLRVLSLDWNDFSLALLDTDDLQLVLGSELVYTSSTAQACAKLIQQVLLEYPGAMVVIVQITDRQGWDDVFLATLRSSTLPSLKVEVEPVEAHLHDVASHLIPMGGTLDRLDFGVCFITRSEHP